jgi:amino-acid N-acetyltransferase
VQRLLRSAQLPDNDLTVEHLSDFLVAGGASVQACVGLERFGDSALLRSLSVEPSSRYSGIGEAALDAWSTMQRHEESDRSTC